MSGLRAAIAILAVTAVVLLVLLAMCRLMGLWTWTSAWIFSSREEKVGLTRLIGHYNANGCLITSDSDIHLDSTGSFQRFDTVDQDFRVSISPTCSIGSDNDDDTSGPESLPPEPARAAPVPLLAPPPSPERSEEASASAPLETPENPSNAMEMHTFSTTEMPLEEVEVFDHMPPLLSRALSCDSVCSDTSVLTSEFNVPIITGFLCIALEYDRSRIYNDIVQLLVNVIEGKELVGLDSSITMNTYVRLYLLPDKTTNLQTRICAKTNCPSYNEKFVIDLEVRELLRRTLVFHCYASGKYSNTLIGEAEFKLSDIPSRQPITTWLTLTESGENGTEYGELMFSLSYLPTAERLTLVIVKARNLKFQHDAEEGDPFVKVYLLQYGKKVYKKKTSLKRADRCPIFNEAMIFSVPTHSLHTIQLRLTVAEITDEPQAYSIGHVMIGTHVSGKALVHWNQMLLSLRRPIGMWHPLKK